MFKRLHEAGKRQKVRFFLDGRTIEAFEGDTVASAILGAGMGATRTTYVNEMPRAPYCMMGSCFECLVTINGAPDRQGCLVIVEDGMDVHRQIQAAELVR